MVNQLSDHEQDDNDNHNHDDDGSTTEDELTWGQSYVLHIFNTYNYKQQQAVLRWMKDGCPLHDYLDWINTMANVARNALELPDEPWRPTQEYLPAHQYQN